MAAGAPAEPKGAVTAMRMVQEARLFRVLEQLRRQQHNKILMETRRAVGEAHDAEAELVFAFDRTSFAESQLLQLASATGLSVGRAHNGGNPLEELSARWQRLEHQRKVEAAEAAMHRHQELRTELGERHEETALAVARLRMLQGLCLLGAGDKPARGDSVTSALRRCEENLLGSCSASSQVEALAAEFEAASPLGLVVPLLRGQRPGDPEGSTTSSSSCVGARGRWLLTAAKSVPTEGNNNAAISRGTATKRSEEDARLQHLVEDLSNMDKSHAPAGGGPPHAKGRAGTSAAVMMLRRELADAYAHLAELDDVSIEEELSALHRRCEEADAEKVALEAAAEAAAEGASTRNKNELAELRNQIKQEEFKNETPVHVYSRRNSGAQITLAPQAAAATAIIQSVAQDSDPCSGLSASLDSTPLAPGSPRVLLPARSPPARQLKPDEARAIQRRRAALIKEQKHSCPDPATPLGNGIGGAAEAPAAT